MKLPDDRKIIFRDYVAQLANEVLSLSEDHRPYIQPFSSEGDQTLLAKSCATCRGHCCVTGGMTFSFINKSTIAKYITHNPDVIQGDIVEANISHIPERSYQNSCVYHSDSGCSLPNPMRATICNSYFCKSLLFLQEQMQADSSTKVYAAATSDKNIVRTALYDTESYCEF